MQDIQDIQYTQDTPQMRCNYVIVPKLKILRVKRNKEDNLQFNIRLSLIRLRNKGNISTVKGNCSIGTLSDLQDVLREAYISVGGTSGTNGTQDVHTMCFMCTPSTSGSEYYFTTSFDLSLYAPYGKIGLIINTLDFTEPLVFDLGTLNRYLNIESSSTCRGLHELYA